jgi:hypothetical protein
MNEDLYQALLKECEAEDDLGLVIRTHIIIEQYLNTLIDSLVPAPEYISKMKLDYSSTVKLAMSLGLNPRFEKALNCLGSIRNGFAHRLRDDISKEDVNNLYKSLSEEDKEIISSGVGVAAKEVYGKSSKQRDLPINQQFVNLVVVLAAALHTACKQAVT